MVDAHVGEDDATCARHSVEERVGEVDEWRAVVGDDGCDALTYCPDSCAVGSGSAGGYDDVAGCDAAFAEVEVGRHGADGECGYGHAVGGAASEYGGVGGDEFHLGLYRHVAHGLEYGVDECYRCVAVDGKCCRYVAWGGSLG